MAALRTSLVLVLGALAVAYAQPPGSNPGLPPSATATGLAPQRVAALAVQQLQQANNYTDADILSFLVNTECLEATFDSFAAFGEGMHPALFGNGPAPQGGRKANLSPEIQLYVEEVARDEIGHVRILREALGPDAPPCPLVDINSSFSQAMSAAFGRQINWDPYKNDINFVLSMFFLEEVGATGDEGATLFTASQCPANLTNVAITGGLAGSAWGQSTADRYILWERRNETIPELGVTVAEAFDRISALRQNLTGDVKIDQPLVYAGGINIIPTDGNGITLARTPQQVLSILTGGASNGKGWFFPNGVNGRINTPEPLNPQVPAELLAEANAPYTIVLSSDQVEDPLAPASSAVIKPNSTTTQITIIEVNGSTTTIQPGMAAMAPSAGVSAPGGAPAVTNIAVVPSASQTAGVTPAAAPTSGVVVTGPQTGAMAPTTGAMAPTTMTPTTTAPTTGAMAPTTATVTSPQNGAMGPTMMTPGGTTTPTATAPVADAVVLPQGAAMAPVMQP